MAQKLVINTPVVDLRREPQFLPQDFSHHPLRETQLLLGEHLELIEEQDEWLKVAALQQKRTDGPYPGWVHRSEVDSVKDFPAPAYVVSEMNGHLSFGTLTDDPLHRRIPKQVDRQQLVEDAKKFLGLPYLWGGCSSLTSVDCSSLIYLLYRAQGLLIPRDAHDQYMASNPTHHPQPGDPVYLSKEKRYTHVILKIDETTFIESPETGKKIRQLKWGEHLSEKGGHLHFIDRPAPYLYEFRTFL